MTTKNPADRADAVNAVAQQPSGAGQPFTAVSRPLVSSEVLERVIVGGDLSQLKPIERVLYYRAVCESVGLNPLTKPLEFLYLNNRLVLYARKEATEQLRQRHGVSVISVISQVIQDANEEMVVVTATGRNKEGREDTATGVVSLGGLHGEQRANAYMKAETKAKRRLTLSLCGLGVLDESEIEIPVGAVRATEVVQMPHPEPFVAVGIAKDLTVEHSVETLFPTPEQDRAGLIQRAKVGVARMDKARVAEIKQDVFGSAEAKYEGVDLAALVAFVQRVEQPL